MNFTVQLATPARKPFESTFSRHALNILLSHPFKKRVYFIPTAYDIFGSVSIKNFQIAHTTFAETTKLFQAFNNLLCTTVPQEYRFL